MIEARRLTRTYDGAAAVNDATFDVGPGRVTAFLGPNGAGKTTTMRMLLGLVHPTSGSVRIEGHSYRDLGRPLRHVGAVLDPAAVHPRRRARDHLGWLARSNEIPAARTEEVLALVGLTDVAGRQVGTYSLGMRQRLAVAAALLGDPAILVLDEPVNGLDTDGIRWVRRIMRTLADEGRTVLVSSHLMDEVQRTADHVVVIARGRIVADAPLADLAPDGMSLEDAYVDLVHGASDHVGGSNTLAWTGGE